MTHAARMDALHAQRLGATTIEEMDFAARSFAAYCDELALRINDMTREHAHETGRFGLVIAEQECHHCFHPRLVHVGCKEHDECCDEHGCECDGFAAQADRGEP